MSKTVIYDLSISEAMELAVRELVRRDGLTGGMWQATMNIETDGETAEVKGIKFKLSERAQVER